MTPTNKEWEKEFEDKFVADNGTSWKMPVGSMSPELLRQFLRSLLSSQAQELNEKHEADIRALRKAVNSLRPDAVLKDSTAGYRDGVLCKALEAFDHTLSQLRSNES